MERIKNKVYRVGMFLGGMSVASQVFAADVDDYLKLSNQNSRYNDINPRGVTDLRGVINNLQGYLGLLLKLLVGAAVVAFLFGVVRYIFSGGDEESRQQGIKFITYGLVGLTVIATMWALVGIVASIFGLSTTSGVPALQP